MAFVVGKDDSELYKIERNLVRAAYCFEFTSPLYDKNQHFESFKKVS